MARTTRMVLDMALVSLEKIRPAVSGAWVATKTYVMESPAKPLVDNVVVNRVEQAIENMTWTVILKLRNLRDKQLPREIEYLEKELEKLKKKMVEKN